MFTRNFSKFHNLYKVPFQNILSKELLYCLYGFIQLLKYFLEEFCFNTGGIVYFRLRLVFFTGFQVLDLNSNFFHSNLSVTVNIQQNSDSKHKTGCHRILKFGKRII